MGTPKLQIFNLLKITQFSKCSIIHVILFWPFVEWLDTNKVKVTHFSLWNWKKVSKISPCIKIPFISLFLNINSSLHECTDYNLYISYICNIDLLYTCFYISIYWNIPFWYINTCGTIKISILTPLFKYNFLGIVIKYTYFFSPSLLAL